MITVLSPAKTLDYSANYNDTHSVPSFLKKSGELVKELKQKEPSEIASLMGLSDKLASLNFDRYQSWKAEKKISDNSKPALLVFKGDVYQGLQAEDFKNGNYKIISFYAKKARGLMARFIIQNRIKKTDELINFDLDGYKYSKADSTADSPVFLRKS